MFDEAEYMVEVEEFSWLRMKNVWLKNKKTRWSWNEMG